MQTVILVGVEASHAERRHCVSSKVLQLVAIEHSFLLVGRNIHQRCHVAFALVGRVKTVQVALLDKFAQTLVVVNSLLGKCEFLGCKVRRPHLNAEATLHGHIKAELERHHTASLMIGHCADVRSHCGSWEEHRHTPLHIYAL